MSQYISYSSRSAGTPGTGNVNDINGQVGPSVSIVPGTGIGVVTTTNTITISNTGGTVTSVTSTNGSIDITNPTTTPNLSLHFPIVAGAGSLAAPSFSTDGSGDGMTSGGTGIVSFSTLGGERLRIDNNGTIEIAPGSTGALVVNGTLHVTGGSTLDGEITGGADLNLTGNVNAVDGNFSGNISAANFPPPPPSGSANTFAGFDNTGALESVPGFNIDTTTGGMNENLTQHPNNGGGFTNNNYSIAFEPLQNSPNENWNVQIIQATMDNASSGFSQGTAGSALQLLNLGITHHGTGDTGGLFFIQTNSDIGNGTDPITVKGMGMGFGFTNVHANVTLDGSLQGWTFQPAVDAASIGTSNFSVSAFEDFANINIPANGYSSFSSGPNIAGITNNHGYNGLNLNPNITTLTGNAGHQGVAVGGTITTMGATSTSIGYGFNTSITTHHGNVIASQLNPTMTGGSANFSGINIQPNGATTGSAQGININLNGLAATGDPQGVVGISSDSRIQVNATTTLQPAQTFQIGTRIENLFHVPSGSPVTGTDSLGLNLAGDLSAEDNVALGPVGLGFASVGFIADMAVAVGKTVDTVNVFLPASALPNPGYTTGGSVTNMYMVRTFPPLSQGGTLNITNLYGFKIDSTFAGPFSAAATNTWGFYTDDNALTNRLYGPLELSTNVSYKPTYSPSFPPGATVHGFYDDSSLTNNPNTAFVHASSDVSVDASTTAVFLQSGSNTAVGAAAGTGSIGLITGQVTDPTATANSGFGLLQTGDNLGTGPTGGISLRSGASTTNFTGAIDLNTGNSSSGGQTGAIILAIGTTSGTRGQIQFLDGTEGTAGYVWTSTDTQGHGAWMAAGGGGGGANVHLSNLSAVAFNVDILPGSSNTLNIGSNTEQIRNIFIGNAIQGPSGFAFADMTAGTVVDVIAGNKYISLRDGQIFDESQLLSIDWQNRQLNASAGGAMLNWFNAGTIDVATNTVSNASDPVNPQDLATKNYVDNLKSALSVDLASNYAVTANNVIKFDAVVSDTDGAYSTGTGLYTVPTGKGGTFRASCVITSTAGGGSIYVKVNGTNVGFLVTISATSTIFSASKNIVVADGDTIGIFTDTTSTISGSSPALSNFSLERVG